MGAAIGMLLGAGLGALGGYAKTKAQQRARGDEAQFEMMQNAIRTGQGVPDTPENRKFTDRLFGDKEASNMWWGMADTAMKGRHQFAQAMTSMSPVASAGAPKLTPISGAPAQASPTDVNALQSQINQIQAHADRTMTMPGLTPAQRAMIRQTANEHITNLRNQINLGVKEQQFSTTKAQQQQFHRDTEADRAASREQTAAMRQETVQLHKDTLGIQKQFKGIMAELARSREEDQRQAHFQSAQQNLMQQTANIAKLLTATTPASPQTVKALLDQRNAMAARLKRTAEKQGIPIDPAEFTPLTTDTVKGWFSSKTNLAPMAAPASPAQAPEAPQAVSAHASANALPPGIPAGSTHGISKTKGPGWRTPDGGFIPDPAVASK